MLSLIRSIPDQLEYGWKISGDVVRKIPKSTHSGIIVCGMGGSGIAGDLLRGLLFDTSPIPIETLKDYSLPSWINQRYLVILISYSGNTEEVLSIWEHTRKVNLPTMAIAAGGLLEEKALDAGIPVVKLVPGNPPRASIGYMYAPLLHLASHLDLYPELEQQLFSAISLIRERISSWEEDMYNSASSLKDSMPVIHSLDLRFHPLAYRLSCQLNENAKMLAHYQYYPEMNHNEIVGFEGDIKNTSLILLDPGVDYTNPRNRQREQIVSHLLPDTLRRLTLSAEGQSMLDRFCSLLVKIDLLSLFIAEARGVDPFPIVSITKLKEELP